MRLKMSAQSIESCSIGSATNSAHSLTGFASTARVGGGWSHHTQDKGARTLLLVCLNWRPSLLAVQIRNHMDVCLAVCPHAGWHSLKIPIMTGVCGSMGNSLLGPQTERVPGLPAGRERNVKRWPPSAFSPTNHRAPVALDFGLQAVTCPDL